MVRILLSYRREDSSGYSGRLFDRLSNHFGADSVFMDIDTIAPGQDFVRAIEQAVESCDVLLALIGPRWLSVSDKNGVQRLYDPDDFVRLEIASALARQIRVIPVLVGSAHMPNEDDLPESLAGIVRRQAIELSDTRFHQDVDRLIEAIEHVLDERPLGEPTSDEELGRGKWITSIIGVIPRWAQVFGVLIGFGALGLIFISLTRAGPSEPAETILGSPASPSVVAPPTAESTAASEAALPGATEIPPISGSAPTPTTLPSTPSDVEKGDLIYGPGSGLLLHDEYANTVQTTNARSTEDGSEIKIADFVVEAVFLNPFPVELGDENGWDFGFMFRELGRDDQFRLYVLWDGTWIFTDHQPPSTEGPEGEQKEIDFRGSGVVTNLDTSADGMNRLTLVAEGDRGIFYLNGKEISELNLASRVGLGTISVGTGFFLGNERANARTAYLEFRIWDLPLE